MTRTHNRERIFSLINNIGKLVILTDNSEIRHIYYHIEKTTQNGLKAEITRRKKMIEWSVLFVCIMTLEGGILPLNNRQKDNGQV